jgi:hypothetical protein
MTLQKYFNLNCMNVPLPDPIFDRKSENMERRTRSRTWATKMLEWYHKDHIQILALTSALLRCARPLRGWNKALVCAIQIQLCHNYGTERFSLLPCYELILIKKINGDAWLLEVDARLHDAHPSELAAHLRVLLVLLRGEKKNARRVTCR